MQHNGWHLNGQAAGSRAVEPQSAVIHCRQGVGRTGRAFLAHRQGHVVPGAPVGALSAARGTAVPARRRNSAAGSITTRLIAA